MSQDRILGSSARIEMYQSNGQMMVVEVDSFTATQNHTTKQRQPLGQVGKTTQVIYADYSLDFSTGKVDSTVVNFFNALDTALLAGQAAPKIRVVETIQHFDGNDEVWIYPDAVLYGYKDDASTSDDEIKETWKGNCRTRIPG